MVILKLAVVPGGTRNLQLYRCQCSLSYLSSSFLARLEHAIYTKLTLNFQRSASFCLLVLEFEAYVTIPDIIEHLLLIKIIFILAISCIIPWTLLYFLIQRIKKQKQCNDTIYIKYVSTHTHIRATLTCYSGYYLWKGKWVKEGTRLILCTCVFAI